MMPLAESKDYDDGTFFELGQLLGRSSKNLLELKLLHYFRHSY